MGGSSINPVNPALLSGLANPQIADISGAFNRGQATRREQDEREKNKLTDAMVGRILGGTLYGELGELARIDPKTAFALADKMGYITNPIEKLKFTFGLIQAAATTAKVVGPREALGVLMDGRIFLAPTSSPEEMKMLDGMIQKLNDNPEEGTEALGLQLDVLIEKGFLKPEDEKFSAITKQLEDGTIIQTSSTGRILVNHQVVTTEERARIVKRAAQEGIRIQGERSTERGQASAAVKRSEKAFDQIEAIRANVLNIDEGIRLIDEGAETGPIAAIFPSVKRASVELDNLQARLGLDVLQSTTFGALSAAELAFALDTALPKKLEGPALRDWFVRKKEAQLKLASYLTELALFIGTPGNSTTDFLQLKQLEQLKAEKEGGTTEIPTPTTGNKGGSGIGRFKVEIIE